MFPISLECFWEELTERHLLRGGGTLSEHSWSNLVVDMFCDLRFVLRAEVANVEQQFERVAGKCQRDAF
jgi:hypothetical protein